MNTKAKFAEAYLDIYNKAKSELENIPWYKFAKRKNMNRRIKWAKFNYDKLIKIVSG